MSDMDAFTSILQQNAIKGARILGEYLDDKRPGSADIKWASLSITQYVKHMATRGVEAGIRLAVIKMIGTNKKDVREMIQTALPEYHPKKSITGAIETQEKA